MKIKRRTAIRLMRLMNKSTGTMKEVYYNIYLYLNGRICKTDLNLLTGYIDSRVRHIYKMVNGQLFETCIDLDNDEVLYEGIY